MAAIRFLQENRVKFCILAHHPEQEGARILVKRSLKPFASLDLSLSLLRRIPTHLLTSSFNRPEEETSYGESSSTRELRQECLRKLPF